MRKTKIICTLGPASSTEIVLRQMVDAGMNVARLNFSHGTHEEHLAKIRLLKKIRDDMNVPLPIMLDTKGPEFRIGSFENSPITLSEGDLFDFTADDVVGNNTRVSVSYKNIASQMFPGDKILLNNGLMTFEVLSVEGNTVHTRCLNSGKLSDHKSMFFPDKELKLEYLSEQDKKDILFGIENGVDFIACSFVSKAQDLIDVRNFLREHGDPDIDLIAKIENRAGVNNLQEIMANCNGVMIGRGDMGVEIPFEELPAIQKHIISECRINGVRVITATEMLESMINNPRPTRAEISDVANAVYDGSSAIMLSGETAAGKYPVGVIAAMSRIALEAEQHVCYIGNIRDDEFKISSVGESLSHSACDLAKGVRASAIVVCTLTGRTARMVSRFRPQAPIIAMTTSQTAFRKLSLSWGVIPVMAEVFASTDVLFYFAKSKAKEILGLQHGQRIVITGGAANDKNGTSLIKVEEI